ncbi:MAG: AI-2E family transporter [Leptonema sp. (in: bacteria)]
MKKIDIPNLIVRILFFTFILLVAFSILYGIKELMLSFFTAFLLSISLNRFVYFFESIGIPRLVSVILVFLLLILFVSFIFQLILPIITEQLNKFYELAKYIVTESPRLIEKFKKEYGHYLPENLNVIQFDLQWILNSILKPVQSLNLLDMIPNILTFLIITPILLFIFMLEGDSIYQYLMSLVPNRFFEMTLMITYNMKNGIVSYLRALVIQVFILAIILVSGLWIIKLPYGIALGIFGAFINIVPYIGPVLGLIPIVAVSLLTDTYFLPLSILVFGLGQLVDNIFTQPIVLAKSVNVHPILAILALITFQKWMGILGMVIAIPVTGILIMTINTMYKSLKSFDVL